MLQLASDLSTLSHTPGFVVLPHPVRTRKTNTVIAVIAGLNFPGAQPELWTNGWSMLVPLHSIRRGFNNSLDDVSLQPPSILMVVGSK